MQIIFPSSEKSPVGAAVTSAACAWFKCQISWQNAIMVFISHSGKALREYLNMDIN